MFIRFAVIQTHTRQNFRTKNFVRTQTAIVKMVKKKIDNRIRVMIENGVKLGHRTMFIIVGDKGRDQVSFKHIYGEFHYKF